MATTSSAKAAAMTKVRRALAASATVAGIGTAAVALPAQPASAHETTINWLYGSATVGAGHAGIRVCSPGTVGVYEARYITFGGARRALPAPYAGGCNDFVDGDGIARYRLCVIGRGCTGWKET